MPFLSIYTYVLALCLLVSLTVYSKQDKGPSYLRLFPPFLLITLVIEVIAASMASKGQNNVTMLNFFSVAQFAFYLCILSLIIKNVKTRKIIRVAIVVYTIMAISNILFYQGLATVHTITYSLGCLLVVAFCIYYFLELFMGTKSGRLWANPSFWICLGLMFFYCCSFPLIGLINYWMHISKFLINNFFRIVDIIHIILYLSFTIAFLCRIRARKYISSPS